MSRLAGIVSWLIKRGITYGGQGFSLAGAVIYWMEGMPHLFYNQPSGSLSMAGVVARTNLRITVRVSGKLGFTQPRYGTEYYKEIMYYGVINP